MRETIDGITYDTAEATFIAKREGNTRFSHGEDTLYRQVNGAFFVHRKRREGTEESIEPLTYEDAYWWVLNYTDFEDDDRLMDDYFNEAYIREHYLPEMEEIEELRTMIPKEVYDLIEEEAIQRNVSMGRVVADRFGKDTI